MGKGGGGGHTPVEAPESGRSKQLIKIVEIVSEGEIQGLVDGVKSVYLDNTPIQAADGSYNFNNVVAEGRIGSQDQDLLTGFNTSEKEVSVGTQVRKVTPLIRTITDSKVNRIRLTLGVQSLFEQNDQGDTNGTEVDFMVTVGSREIPFKISGKYSSQYLKSFTVSDLPPVPFQIRVARLTPDSKSQRLQNNTLWASYTEIIDSEFAYPNTAVVGIKFDSEYFSNVPNRTYEIYGIKVKVPSNYNPQTRTYSGLWDGRFKIAWTNNPVWILNDFLTAKRYGLGQRLGEFNVDKWAFYQAAQYCDQLVPDGFGGREPRFVCNAWLTEQRSAYDTIHDLCSIFRAMPVWNGREFTLVMDRTDDPVWTYTNANVENGEFTYTFSAMKSRANAIQVEYADASNNYEKAIEYVSDDQAIRRYGLNLKKVVAFGCTSRGQAHRTGLWILKTEQLETKTVRFTVGNEGLMHLPGDIIKVADIDYAGSDIGGRVLAVKGREVTLDREIEFTPNSFFSYINHEAKPRDIRILQASGQKITLDDTPLGLEAYGVWSLTTQRVNTQLFKALNVTEEEKGKYTITALQHEPQKEAIVDNGAVFEPRHTTLHTTPQIHHIAIGDSFNGGLNVAAEVSGGSGTVVYDLRLYKGGKLYQNYLGQKSPNLTLDNLPNGTYELVIVAKNEQGQHLSEQSKTFVIERPPQPRNVSVQGGLSNIVLMWDYVDEFTQTEIFASQTNDLRTASAITKISARMYSHEVGAEQVRYYWLRHTKGNNVGAFYQQQGLRGQSGVDIDRELALLNKRLAIGLPAGSIDIAKFARGLEPIKTVESLNVHQYQQAKLVYESRSGRLFTWNGRQYQHKTPASEIDGKIQMGQLADIPTTKLTGQISDQQIAQLNAAKLAGQVQLGLLPAIPTNKLQGQVNAGQVAANAIATNHIQASAVVADKIAANAVNADKITANAVGAHHVQANAIGANHIQANAVEAGKIAANAITSATIQAGAIRADHIAAGQISTEKLAIGLGGNLLPNPILANNGHLARFSNGTTTGFDIRREWRGKSNNDWMLKDGLPNENLLITAFLGSTNNSLKQGQWCDCIRIFANVIPNKWYMFSAYAKAYRSSGFLLVEEYRNNDESGYIRYITSSQRTGETQGDNNSGSFQHGLKYAPRQFVKFRAPETGYVMLSFRVDKWQGDNPDAYFARPMLEECTAHTLEPSPWQNAGVTAIHGGSIVTETITSKQIGADAITANKIAANAIAAHHIAARSITGDKLVAQSISGNEIQANSINASHIAANSVSAAHLVANSITGDKISANSLINAPRIQGGLIEGGTIRGARIESVTGKFTGELEVTQLVGGNIYESMQRNIERTNNTKWESRTNGRAEIRKRFLEYAGAVRVTPIPVRRLIKVEFITPSITTFSSTRDGGDKYNDYTVTIDDVIGIEHSVTGGYLTNGEMILEAYNEATIRLKYWLAEESRHKQGYIRVSAFILSNSRSIVSHPY